jgi:hypothetical protein
VPRIRRWWCRPVRFAVPMDKDGLRVLAPGSVKTGVECGLGSLKLGEEPVTIK